ncbi:hypothetical protein LIER_37460 [Lithospermum erythrorhizon]|uniref:Uncharacterized protein n=1 Tax=Lithospermum erythrorhizon TaxID=34254 RepID=A0AAV3PQS2_LITER
MASSSAFSAQQHPTRSISLPPKLQHPTASKFETKINSLKTFEVSTTVSTVTPVSAESLENSLVELAEIYNCVQELLQSSTTQHCLLHHQNTSIVDEALEESIELLDSCTNIQNLYHKIKENVQNLQSAMRRKGGVYSSKENDISAYLSFRKKTEKDITKGLRTLKNVEKRLAIPFHFNLDQHLSMVVRLIRELTIKTVSILRSSLIFLSCPGSKTKWSMISKLMLKKSCTTSKKGELSIYDAGSVDIVVLSSLHMQNDDNAALVTANSTLMMFEHSITKVEIAVEGMFRQLVQYRVSLLNILTQSL